MNNKSIQSRIYNNLFDNLLSHHQFIGGDQFVIAVSGGADSLALLHTMCKEHHQGGNTIHVATLDHGLRGEQGADDARYVEQLASEWGVPCTRGTVDVKALAAEWGVGIETAARRARYDFLAKVAYEVHAYGVVTAHHADDQAETILMRLLRGTSIEGLIGMQFESRVPEHPDLNLFRPLLDTTKAELVAYCAEVGISPREDSTNTDTAYHRNRIRHEVLPYLRTLNPQVDRALIQLADIALHEDEYIQWEFERILRSETTRLRGERVVFPHGRFRTMQKALQRRFIIWAAREVEPDIELNFERVLAAVNLAQRYSNGETNVGAMELLGSGVRLRIDYNVLVIEHENTPFGDSIPLLYSPSEALPPEHLRLLNKGWSLRLSSTPPSDVSAPVALHVSPNAILELRGREDGDTMRPARLQGHSRKLSRWMIDQKIPLGIRDSIPLLLVHAEIAAILWQPNPQIDIDFAPADDKPANLWLWFEKTDDHED